MVFHPKNTTQPNHYRFTRIVATCLLLSLLPSALANNWEKVVEEEHLLVERRPYSGSALQEIKGVTRLKASVDAVMALLKDAKFNHKWVYRSGGASILEQQSDQQAYVYGIVDAPWPMSDRDTVVRFDYQQPAMSEVITITITNFPNYIPTRANYVRVPDFGGYWQLKPQQDGWIEITYQVHGDPGGRIPVWLANYAAVTSVTKTLQNMSWAVEHYNIGP